MRRSTRTLVLCGSVLFLWSCQKAEDKAAAPPASEGGAMASAETPAAPAGRPVRKAGLWEHTMETMGVTQTSRMCIDAETDKNVQLWGQQVSEDSGCEQNTFTPTAGGYSFVSVCPDGQGGKVTSRGAVTGDFNSAYRLEATTTTTGSSMPQANGEMKMVMNATWKGPCPEGMKPGDIQLSIPGAGTVNLDDVAKMAEQMSKR
ncbi:MAG: DUF3617 family protein [Phenylobacterium sp.]|jgi:hypothetical protein|uniref:DUF3617 domain-containing protein n=1 Tax=Phenylobacterium sp. TaxID=1871053 RepID=UPI002A36EC4D|nr:DUF3617 family protein [Phenylobacterium sp.]MDX9999287.1 DUF3617 family protein [Phenylobacterium sp.]